MKRIKAILVHGTFAQDTHWDDPNGEFATKLKAHLREKDAHLDVDEFRWNAKNDHEKRRVAALRLRDVVAKELQEDHDALYLVAHSHGGTVTRLALNSLPAGPRPTGVFTFGSPFVRFRPRNIQVVTKWGLWLGRILAFLLILLLANSLYQGGIFGANNAVAMVFIAAICTALGFVFIYWLPARIERFVRERLVQERDFLTSRFDPAEETVTPYVCFHATFDEAGLLLRILVLHDLAAPDDGLLVDLFSRHGFGVDRHGSDPLRHARRVWIRAARS